jgi:hypothetical protein
MTFAACCLLDQLQVLFLASRRAFSHMVKAKQVLGGGHHDIRCLSLPSRRILDTIRTAPFVEVALPFLKSFDADLTIIRAEYDASVSDPLAEVCKPTTCCAGSMARLW